MLMYHSFIISFTIEYRTRWNKYLVYVYSLQWHVIEREARWKKKKFFLDSVQYTIKTQKRLKRRLQKPLFVLGNNQR